MKTVKKVNTSSAVKVAAVSPLIRLADIEANVDKCIEEVKRSSELGAKVLLFPELTFSGVTCFDLYLHSAFVDSIEKGLERFINSTAQLDVRSFVSVPVSVGAECYCCTAAVYHGELLGLSPKSDLSPEESRYFDTPTEESLDLFYAGRKTTLAKGIIFIAPFDKNIKISVSYTEGANLIVDPFASAETVRSREYRRESVRAASGRIGVAYMCAGAGLGESTTDAVYAAHNIIADRGEILAEAEAFADDTIITAEVRISDPIPDESYDAEISKVASVLDIPDIPTPDPFLSADASERRQQCYTALEIQSRALAARVERSYSKTMVIGVSGGLDSTLALLVCVRAADILGLDRKKIIGVTLPCFGTTGRTKSNAEKLCEALQVSLRTVDIKKSVTQHLEDIGHDGHTTDVTYENAQARERTQVLMDVANMTGGLVVGTGDLSELVLGWATYNGDHMSMYAVNASIPKTMVRRIVEVYSDDVKVDQSEVSRILDDILATPVSPELLPPKDGEIAQCTEALVGPYELHDFFIYYMLKYACTPRKIYTLARTAFEGVYDKKTILSWLRVFIRRFFSQQFKRSCMPDGPKVSEISVSPRCALRMPSDMSAAVWLGELDEIEKEEA